MTELDSNNSEPELTKDVERRIARFKLELALPNSGQPNLPDAKKAVRDEFRSSSKWKRLRCHKISVMAEKEGGVVYALHVGSFIEFDWTWEGAIAFRPHALSDDGDRNIDLADFESSPVEEACLWSGEVLEVDEQNGCLLVKLTNPEDQPTAGPFFVRPYDFLATLESVFHDPIFESLSSELEKRLYAAKGGVYPKVSEWKKVGLDSMVDWWHYAWAILWGPPGTGKTYTTGQQIARVLADPTERILLVSTTNRATDEAAISLGKGTLQTNRTILDQGNTLRIGKGASYSRFVQAELEVMLSGTEAAVLQQLQGLSHQLAAVEDLESRAFLKKKIAELRGKGDESRKKFFDPAVRAIVATAYKAMSFLNDETVRRLLENREAPFTTVFIDEAGLISRAAVAALSLLASRRVVLVGDSKQLAPISRMSRLSTSRQQEWMGSSGLSHLKKVEPHNKAIFLLSQQRRMHPDICKVVSEYQYDGMLKTADDVAKRKSNLPGSLASLPRAFWYILDAEGTDLASIRAERGPGNRSWIRSITIDLMERLLQFDDVRKANGLFISPYKAQANWIGDWLRSHKIESWEASTVHSQQGSEADIVIYDTVNAGSTNWPIVEWQRLVNVGVSRAREMVIFLASISEMEEPHLRMLARLMPAGRFQREGGKLVWEKVECKEQDQLAWSKHIDNAGEADVYGNLGAQINQRKRMKPILSYEQQRLSNLELDGKPRLVRGVAGSGKTVVLSSWLAKTARRITPDSEEKIWAVYANRSLHKLIRESVEAAWKSGGNLFEFPWENVELLHVKDVLAELLPLVSLRVDSFEYEYDRAAEEFLKLSQAVDVLPKCRALFIDEAQDMGPNTLRLLLSLVEQSDNEDPNSRSAHIFYDNAQNVYKRRAPKWSDFGLDMRGRSTIMRESFRSTQQITEYAVNVLHRLVEKEELHDHKELVSLGLLNEVERGTEKWLKVNYNQVQGPLPRYRHFSDHGEVIQKLASDIRYLVTTEGIQPCDICILYNGKDVAEEIESQLTDKLNGLDVELSKQTNRSFERKANTIILTTSQSFKGYESEVVLIPFAERFAISSGEVLAASLYVALTRARSLLAIYTSDDALAAGSRLRGVLRECSDLLAMPPDVEMLEEPK